MQKVLAIQLALPLLLIIAQPFSAFAGSCALASDTGCDVLEDATGLLQNKLAVDKNEQSTKKGVLKERSYLDTLVAIPEKFGSDVPSPAKPAKKGKQRSLSNGRYPPGKLSFIKKGVGSFHKEDVTELAAAIPTDQWKALYDACHKKMMNGLLTYDNIMYVIPVTQEKGYFTWQNCYDEWDDHFNIQGNGAAMTPAQITYQCDWVMSMQDLNNDGLVSYLEAAKYFIEKHCSAVGLSVPGVMQAEADNREYEEAYGCTTGNSGTACLTCVARMNRQTDAHCATCNPGYTVSGTSCLAYGCTTGNSGTACLTCVALVSRQTDAHCATCNPGYTVSGTSCLAYGCTTGNSGTACLTCVALVSRQTDAHCATCNPGYTVSGTSCLAYGCTTGNSGTACLTCVAL